MPVARRVVNTRLRKETTRILDAAPDGILCLDLDGRILFANFAALRMLGYTRAELRGQPVRAHIEQSEAPGDQMGWRADGTSFPIECHTAPLSGDDATTTGSLLTFRDITR